MMEVRERNEAQARFYRLCRTVAANACRYRTKHACISMHARVRRAWERRGGYGCERGELLAAIAACQDRWLGLDGEERDARWARVAAGEEG